MKTIIYTAILATELVGITALLGVFAFAIYLHHTNQIIWTTKAIQE